MDSKDKAQVRDISKKITVTETATDPRGMNKDRLLLKNSKDYERSQASRQEKGEFLITHMRNKWGTTKATRKGIAKVFAEFYKDLFSRKQDETKDNQSSESRLESICDHPNDDIENDEQDSHVRDFAKHQLTAANDCLKKRTSADSRGIKAEDIKRSSR